MPQGNPSSDKDFAGLSLSDKFAYLHDTDPDFKSLSPGDQQAYVNHVTKAPSAPESTPETTQFESERGTQGSPWERMASGAGAAVKSMLPSMDSSPPSGMEMLQAGIPAVGAIGALKGAGSEYGRARQEGQGVIPSAASAVGSAIGLDPSDIRERASKGDYAGLAGEAIPSTIATLLGSGVGRTAGKVSEFGRANPGLARGVTRDVASRYISPRLAQAILPEEETVQSMSKSPNWNAMKPYYRPEKPAAIPKATKLPSSFAIPAERPEMQPPIPRAGSPTPLQSMATRIPAAEPPAPVPLTKLGGTLIANRPEMQPVNPRSGPTPAQSFANRLPVPEIPEPAAPAPLKRLGGTITAERPEMQPNIPRASGPSFTSSSGPAVTFQIPSAATEATAGTGKPPLRPLIGTEGDWRSFDQKMGILKPEAQASGMYHAARGGAGRPLTLQERLAARMRK